jgi:membrane fusion protein (multidrug efflux system)
MKILVRLLILATIVGAGVYWYATTPEGAERLAPILRYADLFKASSPPGGAVAPVPKPGSAPGGGAGNGPGGGPPMGVPVEAAPASTGSVSRTVTAVGTLLSDESVIVRPEVAGRIVEIGFTEGQPVRKGDVLIRLDDAIARATLEQALASLNLSRVESDRADELYRQGSGSARNRDQAHAKLQADEASVSLARAQLAKYLLIAPFDGVIGLRRVSIGDVVEANKDIVNLEAINVLKVDFRVPELYLPSVAVGQTVAVTVDALPNRPFDGKVYAIDPLIDVNGRSINIRARLPNKDGALRPGLFARVALTLTTRENSVLVPEQALVPQGRDHFVFKVVNGNAALTKVRIGERRSAQVEILDGLAPGDMVVTAGHLKIRDGAPVTVLTAAAGS